MSRKDVEPTGDAAVDQISALKQLQDAGFGTVIGANAAWLENLGDIGAEVLRFFAERITEDVKTQHEIMHCTNPAELQKIQARFIQKAIDQYQTETGKLVQMSQSAFTDKTPKAD